MHDLLAVLPVVLGTVLLYAAPLLLAGLGGLFSERSGIVNIGLEGLMTVGAFVAAAMTWETTNPWIGLLFAALAGGLFSLLHAFATVTLQADHVVSGVAINLLGVGLAIYACKALYGTAQTPALGDHAFAKNLNLAGIDSLPVIGGLFSSRPIVYLALLLAVLIFFLLYRTVWGLRLRSVGENPHAAAAAGINVIGMRYTGVLLSGVFAGLGGAFLAIVASNEFNTMTVAGQGFIALAALIFGKWNPLGVLGASLFFSCAVSLTVLGPIFQLDDYFPSEWVAMLPYAATLLALAGFVGKTEPPKALGRHFTCGERQ